MCRPFTDYFAVPPPPGQGKSQFLYSLYQTPLMPNLDQCASYLNVLIIQGCFNVTSDIGVLLVGIPLLLLARVAVQQKIGVIVVFGMGIFVIIAAILNKVYSTLPSLLNDSVNYTFWYMREVTVSVYVINLPTLWPVLRQFFPMLTGRGSSAANSKGNTSNINHSKSWPASRKRTQISSNINEDAFEMKTKRNEVDAYSEGGSTRQIVRGYFGTSQEHIIDNGQMNGKSDFKDGSSVIEINHDVTFTQNTELPADGGIHEWKAGGGYRANVQAGNNRDEEN